MFLLKKYIVNNRYGNVKSHIQADGPTQTPGNLTLTDIHVDQYRSLVSLITMIFPSPDWFLGISNVDMCNPMTGEWREEYSRDLLPYDSGTDDGTSFESDNSQSDPRKNIFLIGKSRRYEFQKRF